jgi:hypothetical protein
VWGVQDAFWKFLRSLLSQRRQFTAAGPFNVTHGWFTSTVTDRVLGKAQLYTVVEPHHPVSSIDSTPFFFQDSRHAFFVRPGTRLVTMPSWHHFAVEAPAQDVAGAEIRPVLPTSPADGGRIIRTLDTGPDFVFDGRRVGAAGSTSSRAPE